MLIKKAPQIMEFLFNSNPFALPRMLMRQTKFMSNMPALKENARVGDKSIDESVFQEIILRNIAPVSFSNSIILVNKKIVFVFIYLLCF